MEVKIIIYPKVFYYDTGTVENATWMGPLERNHCVYSTAPIIMADGRRVSYQCRITALTTLDGHKICWRHYRMHQKNKKIILFPPGQ